MAPMGVSAAFGAASATTGTQRFWLAMLQVLNCCLFSPVLPRYFLFFRSMSCASSRIPYTLNVKP